MGSTEPHVERLLRLGDESALAGTLRGLLIGMRATMGDAAERDPADPGLAACQDVLRWLDSLLPNERGPAPAGRDKAPAGSAGEPADRGGASDAVTEAPDPASLAWRALLRSITADRHVVSRLGAETVQTWRTGADDPATRPEEQWQTVQMRLLRLPDALARRIRDELWRISGDEPRASVWREVSADGAPTTVLVAPLDGAGTGIRAAAGAKPDPDVLDSLCGHQDKAGRLPPPAAELALLASALLTVADLDDDLWLCLESLQFRTSIRLNDDGRRRLWRELLGRLREYARHSPASAQALLALVAVDEALHALIHLPVAAQGSWWEHLSRRSRVLLDQQAKRVRAAGHDVEIRPLLLDYRSVRDLTAGNDVPVNIGGQPGDVLACLRVWARIGGQEHPGRVLYRASE